MKYNKNKINIGIIGLGNCAKSLIEGIAYFRNNNVNDFGLMKSNIGGYVPKHIDVVLAFDIDERKINICIGEAIYSKPNCAKTLYEVGENEFPNLVCPAPILDGFPVHMKDRNKYKDDEVYYPFQSMNISFDEICNIVNKYKVEENLSILVNYLPVGSQKATEFWAEICLETGVSFLNCIPVFIASDSSWEQKFIDKGIPIIGDDMKSEFGASILSQMFQELAHYRAHKVKSHIQRNVGGNTDFLTMEDKTRLKSKKKSKENVINFLNDNNETYVYAGPSEYISYLKDTKIANFRIELEGFLGSPVLLEAQLTVQDSPNSAGVVIDAIRYLQVAREMGIVGALRGPSAFTQKTPPIQMSLADSLLECDLMAKREYSKLTNCQIKRNDKNE